MKKVILILASMLPVALSAQTHIHSFSELNKNEATLNSHVAEIDRCSLEPDFRTKRVLGEKELGQQMLDYGRIKRLQDGSYIMFYQPLRVGYHIYVSFSQDCVNWTKGQRVFEGYKFTNADGEEDKFKYATADAVQLQNGDILAFCIFHTEKHYGKRLNEFGVTFKRSKDGGHTWGEERVLYNTVNWEPYPMQLEDGEILVFFTDSDWDWNPNSSGTSILRSKDNGETWTLQKQAIRQFRAVAKPKQRSVGTPIIPADSTRKVFTDQMPVVCKLNCSNESLAVLESANAENRLSISLAWEDSHWPTTLTGNMEGPSKRRNRAFEGSGPYVMQFPSGETAVTYGNGNGYFACRLGNETGWDIPDREEFLPFGPRFSRWGSIEKVDAHTAVTITTDPYKGANVEKGRLMLTQMRLNHRVDAPKAAIAVDGKNLDWESATDALFLGSNTQAQCSFRFAHDAGKLYILAECLDAELLSGDGLTLLLGNGRNAEGVYKVFVDAGPKKVSVQSANTLKAASYVSKGEGYMVEISIDESALSIEDGKLYVNAILYKGDNSDTFTNIPTFAYDKWIPVSLK